MNNVFLMILFILGSIQFTLIFYIFYFWLIKLIVFHICLKSFVFYNKIFKLSFYYSLDNNIILGENP